MISNLNLKSNGKLLTCYIAFTVMEAAMQTVSKVRKSMGIPSIGHHRQQCQPAMQNMPTDANMS